MKKLVNIDPVVAVFSTIMVGLLLIALLGLSVLIQTTIETSKSHAVVLSSDSLEYVSHHSFADDYTIWRKGNHHYLVQTSHQVHVHSAWCDHLFTCKGTQIYVDRVYAYPIEVDTVLVSGTVDTYKVERKLWWE